MKKRTISLVVFTALWCLPVVVLADSCGGTGTGIQNPLSSAYCNIPNFIAGFLRVMVQIGLPIVGLFTLLAGYKFISAGGNSEKLASARENLVYVLVGAMLILGAWVLATLI